MLQLDLKIPDGSSLSPLTSSSPHSFAGFRPHKPVLIPLGAGYYAQFRDSKGAVLSEYELSQYGTAISLWHESAHRLQEILLSLGKKYSSPLEYHKSGNLCELRIKNSLFPITSLCAHPRIADSLHRACTEFCQYSPVYFISHTGRFFICPAEESLISMVSSWLDRPPIRFQSGFFSAHPLSHAVEAPKVYTL